MTDNYVWRGTISTDWNTAGNWEDTTTGQTASTAPNANDDVTIVSTGGATDVVSGTGTLTSAALTLGGSVELEGTFATGGMTVSGTLEFAAGGQATDSGAASFANGAAIDGGTLTVAGAATFAGSATLDNASLSVGSDTGLSSLTLEGAVILAGDVTTAALVDSALTSLTLGTGTFDVTSTATNVLPALSITGAAILEGSFLATSLTLVRNASLQLNAGDSLTVQTASFQQSATVALEDGAMIVTGAATLGSSFSVDGAGSFTVKGAATTYGGTIQATNNSRIQLASLNDANGGMTLSVDSTSSIEIGSAGDATSGTITIDAGSSVTESGEFEAPSIVDNGTIEVTAGKALTIDGTSQGLSGAGKLVIEAASSLTLEGIAAASANSIGFAATGGLLWLGASDLNSTGTLIPKISGFGSTDVIEFDGAVTSATYNATTGVLTLLDGSTAVANLSIGAGYANAFATLTLGTGPWTQIDYLGGGTDPAPAGTTSADSYTWTGQVAGRWDAVSNWSDTTTGKSPAAVAPGANDLVTIQATASGAAQVVIGNGDAASLTIEGETLLEGTFAAGTLNVTAGTVVLETADSLSISGEANIADGAVTLEGGSMKVTGEVYSGYGSPDVIAAGGELSAGSLLLNKTYYGLSSGGEVAVSGGVSDSGQDSYISVDDGVFTVAGSFVSSNDTINATNSGRVQLAQLQQGVNTSGGGLDYVVLSADAKSSIEIGTAGHAATGAITIDSGVKLTESGTFTAPDIIVQGTLAVAGDEALTLVGALTGSGPLQIGSGSSLYLDDAIGSSAETIAFTGSGGALWLYRADLNASHSLVPVITGFSATNVLDFAGAVTAANYSKGILTLTDNGAVVANLTIGAGYTNTFAALSVDNGQWTQIDYLGGGTNAAPAGTTNSDSYVWTGPVSGSWNRASNWTDTSTGSSTTTVAPGANDLVTIDAQKNGAAQVLIGNGDAESLTIEGQTLFDGAFETQSYDDYTGTTVLYTNDSLTASGSASFGQLSGLTLNGGIMTVGGGLSANYAGSVFTIENDGALSAGSLQDTRSYYQITSGGDLSVAGNVTDGNSYESTFAVDDGVFTVGGTFISADDYIESSNKSRVQIASLIEGNNSVTLSVDSTSSIEIGTVGHAATDAITIDAGVSTIVSGLFLADNIVNEGKIVDDVGQVLNLYGALSGSGTIQISAGAVLNVDHAGGSSSGTINFGGPDAAIEISTDSIEPSGQFVPDFTGFSGDNIIEMQGTATRATYSNGVLSLLNGTKTVAELTIGAGYSNEFSALSVERGAWTQINYLGGGTSAAPAGTSTADSYVWSGPVAGDWNAVANWTDSTTGKNPASVAPGANDIVTINAVADGAAQIIIGNGNAAALNINGETLLDGTFDVGTVDVTLAQLYLYANNILNVTGAATFAETAGITLDGGKMTVGGAFDGKYPAIYTVEAGGVLSAGSLTDSDSQYFVSTGGQLLVKGNISDSTPPYTGDFWIDDAVFTVGGTLTAADDVVSATNNSRVQIANLNGATGAVTLTADASSSIEIGAVGGATTGAITIDAGKTVTASGTFTAPAIVDKGTLAVAQGQSLTLAGALSGTGSLQIGAGSTLSLTGINPAATDTIDFTGATGTLRLYDADLNSLGAVVTKLVGFSSTGVLDFQGAATSASYATTSASGGVLTLLNGSAAVATVTLNGTFTNAFSALSIDGGQWTQIDYLGGGTDAAPAGTSSADDYVWSGAVAGHWDAVANWTDTTTGKNPAPLAPGSKDLVTIEAAANGAAQVIIGNGDAAALTIEGETLLDGVFMAASLDVTAGSAVLYAHDTLTVSGAATFGGYAGATMQGGKLSIGGSLYSSYGSSFTVESSGTLSAGSLVDNQTYYAISSGGSLTVAGSVTDGSSGAGLFTLVDGGMTVGGTLISSNDSINATVGSRVQLAMLQQGVNAAGVAQSITLAADATSSIEIGTAGKAASGAITIDAGVTVTEAGSFSAPDIVDKGTLAASAGETLTLSGALTGAGTVDIGAGSSLYINNANASSTGTSADSIDFTGAGGSLWLAQSDLNASRSIVPSINGFASGDAIDYQGLLTSVAFSGSTLTLLDNGSTVATLDLVGNYAGWTFSLSSGWTTSKITAAPGGDAPPVITAPTQVWSGENVAVPVAGVSVSDATAVSTMNVKLTATNGDLIATTGVTSGGGTIQGSGTTALTISGTVSQVDADLTTLQYEGLTATNDTISISASNGIGGTATQSIAVTYDATFPHITVALADDTGISGNDDITSNAALSGSGDAGAVVHFTIDGVASSSTATADAKGAWTFTPTGLKQGTNTVVATETDAHGNAGSGFLTFTYDTAPPTLAITSAGGSVKQMTQTISGAVDAADAGLTVSIYDGTTLLGTATPTATGAWSTAVELESTLGAQSITAQATDAAGNVGTSKPVIYTLQALGPTLSITNAGELPDSKTQTLKGTIDVADSELPVSIYDDGKLVGQATANSAGAWTATVKLWGAGRDVLVAEATDGVGATGVSNEQDLLVGASQSVVFPNGAGNTASLYATGAGADSLRGSGALVYLNSAAASVIGGGDTFDFASGTGNSVTLSGTDGNWDAVNGSNGSVWLTNAQTDVTGNSDTVDMQGTSSAIVKGATEAFVFQAAIGHETIGGFASTDSMQFAKTDFANWAALSKDTSQSGSNTLITLDANDTVTLTGVTATTLTASQFHFV